MMLLEISRKRGPTPLNERAMGGGTDPAIRRFEEAQRIRRKLWVDSDNSVALWRSNGRSRTQADHAFRPLLQWRGVWGFCPDQSPRQSGYRRRYRTRCLRRMTGLFSMYQMEIILDRLGRNWWSVPSNWEYRLRRGWQGHGNWILHGSRCDSTVEPRCLYWRKNIPISNELRNPRSARASLRAFSPSVLQCLRLSATTAVADRLRLDQFPRLLLQLLDPSTRMQTQQQCGVNQTNMG